MNDIKKIVGVNLLVLVAYTLLINLTSHGSERQMAVAIFMAMAVGVHVFFCLMAMLFSYVRKNKSHGRAWLLATGIVLVVGFSACYGSSVI